MDVWNDHSASDNFTLYWLKRVLQIPASKTFKKIVGFS